MGSSISNLDKALPVKGRALFLRKNFNSSLLDSLKYLIQACEEVLSPDSFSAAIQKIDALKKQPKVSGFLSLIHRDLLQAIEQNDKKKVKDFVNYFLKDNFQVEQLTFINLDDQDAYYKTCIKQIVCSEVIENISFFPLLKDEAEKMKIATQRGFSILKKSCPDFFEEATYLISEVLFLSGERKNVHIESNRYKIAGSCCDIFGMIYINSLHKWEKITDILDFIVHELSHLYIYALNKDDPFLLNPRDLYESPLRSEKRPLMGSYHATFVLARVVYVLKKALQLNAIPDSEKNYCNELIAFYEKRFHFGFDLLNRYAQMTELAKNLIHSTPKLVA